MRNAFFCSLILIGLNLNTVFALSEDSYLWLEGINDPKALEWVDKMNTETAKNLAESELYKEIYTDTLKTLQSTDKLPEIKIMGPWVYSLSKDEAHPRGIYKRSSIRSFKRGEPDWETVLDIDAMSEEDGIKWVFHGMDCLSPDYEKCLVFLSPGGGDADEMREFNSESLDFVEDGFQLPKAKMNVSWADADHLFVSTDFGEDSLTDSGYARTTKLWKRGTALKEAKEIFSVSKSSVWAYGQRLGGESNSLDLMTEGIDYWNRHYQQWADGKLHKLNLPTSAVIEDLIGDDLVIKLVDDWQTGKSTFTKGSIILVKPDSLWEDSEKVLAHVLRKSTQDSIIENVEVNKDRILVTVLEDVKSKVYSYQKLEGQWLAQRVDLPESGQIEVAASDSSTGEFFARFEDFLTPPTLYSVDPALNTKLVLQQPPSFDSSDMKVEQYFVKSSDGTDIPYFVVMKKDTELNGKNPTQLFSYGGFRVSLTPSYSGSYEAHNGTYGKAWLERGGVFVLANIRGGAEYGPQWHASVLRENRIKAFEDFEAIAQDLADRKITSAPHLGIEGRSNGGLLVGATMIRRPDLYGAVICGVPLLDMQRYNKLLAGASWMAEYGNPDTEDWDFIKTYSPYQNLEKDQEYPPIFFYTSTQDDRVHPGHARKMAARMKEQGHVVEYYENTEGGHKGSATAEQTARRIALSFSHLWNHLQ